MHIPNQGDVVRLRGIGGDFYVTSVDIAKQTADLIQLSGKPCVKEMVPLCGILPPLREGWPEADA